MNAYRALILAVFVLTCPLSAQQSGRQGLATNKEQSRAVVSAATEGEGRICDAQTVRSSTGSSFVIGSIDYSGRRFCNSFVVVSAEAHKLIANFSVWNIENVSTTVKDLDGNGDPELVLPVPLSQYEGSKCIALWHPVYSCTAVKCSDRSSDFLGFYAEELNRLQRQLAASPPPGSAAADANVCTTMERDKAIRVLGGNPTAGLETAQVWMKSSDASLRRKAVSVFGDVDDPKAYAALEEMLRDADGSLAEQARAALSKKNQNP